MLSLKGLYFEQSVILFSSSFVTSHLLITFRFDVQHRVFSKLFDARVVYKDKNLSQAASQKISRQIKGVFLYRAINYTTFPKEFFIPNEFEYKYGDE